HSWSQEWLARLAAFRSSSTSPVTSHHPPNATLMPQRPSAFSVIPKGPLAAATLLRGWTAPFHPHPQPLSQFWERGVNLIIEGTWRVKNGTKSVPSTHQQAPLSQN